MELHALTLQAIGPFAGSHHIDFDALGVGGLFLLEGPTGAGKSTIIDAIVFALYGDVAADGSSKDRIPSAYAAGRKPVVSLVFSVPGGVFRVERSPEYQRPKARGSGMTTEKATAVLTRLSGPDDADGVHLASGGQAVGHELAGLLGLTKAQFTQTVVLPQGQFATFLKAAPEERRTILQDIFGTELFERVQAELRLRARDAEQAIDTATTQLLAATGGLATAVGLDEQAAAALTGPAADLDADRLVQHVTAVVADIAARHVAADTAAAAARQQAEKALEVFSQAKSLAAALAERQQLLARQAELNRQQHQMDRLREVLHRADRATGAAARCREAAEADTAAAQAAGQLAEILAGVDDADRDLAGLVAVDQLTDAAAAAEVQRGQLAQALRLEQSLDGRATQLATREVELAAVDAALAARAVDLDNRGTQRADLARRRVDADSAGADRAAATVALAEATALAAAAHRATKLTVDLAAARAKEAECQRQAAMASASAATIRTAWLSGLADTLAADLVDGQPCPVCGSASHPAPAHPGADAATRDDAEAAESARDTARQQVTAAEHGCNVLADQLAQARTDSGHIDPATADAAVAGARAREQAAAAAVELAVCLRDELDAFDQRTAQAADALAISRTEQAAARAALQAAQASLDADRSTVTASRGIHPSVAAASDRCRLRAECATRLADARRQVASATAEAKRRRALAATELAAAGFTDANQALAADLPEEKRKQAVEQLKAHDGEQAAVVARLASAALTAAATAEAPDLAATQMRAEQTADIHSRARAELGAAANIHETAARLGKSVIATLDRHRTLSAKAGPLRRMAELATAGPRNTAQLTLATFVLLRRFEEVIDHANARLQTMSAGQYRLRRVTGREGGMRSRRTGLGLEIVDHFTDDAARNPHTLSGGETFIVSLCLALGLADAVSSQAGGIDMKTLFIDEGFGTLDSSTLDTVMAELDRLRDGGRVIGVVSHVTELKSRIAERISVARVCGGGSTLTVVAP